MHDFESIRAHLFMNLIELEHHQEGFALEQAADVLGVNPDWISERAGSELVDGRLTKNMFFSLLIVAPTPQAVCLRMNALMRVTGVRSLGDDVEVNDIANLSPAELAILEQDRAI